jgi:muramoyltetrapeptide carboxypeptidase
MDVRVPARLRPGDLIGVIAPASPMDDCTRVERGVRYLESCGYRTITGKHAGKRSGYLAGTDEERAEDIGAMFADRRVNAIICIRGGYGTPRLLARLDYAVIRKNPKIFVGYSDITALHLAFWARARLVTFHGPMLGVDMAGTMDPFAEEALWRLLTSPSRQLIPPESGGMPLTPGRGTGRLLGGNLSLLVSLFGTPYQPAFRHALLFLEEIGEEPYRVDRMLTQLRNAGLFRQAAGIALGQFTDCVPKDAGKPSQTVEEIVRECAAGSSRPFVAGLPFGHERKMVTIPVGVRAALDGRAGSLELLEPAVC